jgi:hypothetical protein
VCRRNGRPRPRLTHAADPTLWVYVDDRPRLLAMLEGDGPAAQAIFHCLEVLPEKIRRVKDSSWVEFVISVLGAPSARARVLAVGVLRDAMELGKGTPARTGTRSRSRRPDPGPAVTWQSLSTAGALQPLTRMVVSGDPLQAAPALAVLSPMLFSGACCRRLPTTGDSQALTAAQRNWRASSLQCPRQCRPRWSCWRCPRWTPCWPCAVCLQPVARTRCCSATR